MQLTSLIFLYGFLPLSIILYTFFRKSRMANGYIFVISLLFYAFGSVRSFIVLLVVLLWNYICGLQMARTVNKAQRKKQLVFCNAINVLILFFYRYLGVWFGFMDSWLPTIATLPKIMPAGLSFYLFSCMSYVFDVYYQKAPVMTSFIDLGVFAAFFGRVNMGPIGNYETFAPQLKSHPVTRAKNYMGVQLLVQGLFRKVFLADSLGVIYAGLAGNMTWLGALLHGFAYFFQLYFDFSGYSKMARGIGYLFGFEIPANFDLPYCALSVQDFWRRWHISLTSWFRNYVYIPLGGNRVRKQRWMLNVMAVWLLTGLWHGATLPFIIWGIYQGALILAEHQFLGAFLKRMPGFVKHIYVVITQLIGWTMFSSSGFLTGMGWIGRMFGIGISALSDAGAMYWLLNSWVLFIIAIWLASGLSFKAGKWIKARLAGYFGYIQTAGYGLELIFCTAMLVSSTAQTFLYAVF